MARQWDVRVRVKEGTPYPVNVVTSLIRNLLEEFGGQIEDLSVTEVTEQEPQRKGGGCLSALG